MREYITITSKISYEKDEIIQDNQSKEVFKVLSCNMCTGSSFTLKIQSVTKKMSQKAILLELTIALSGLKIHDKDLFMLENIVSKLSDTFN